MTAEAREDELLIDGTGPPGVHASVALCLDEIRSVDDYLLCDMPQSVDVTTGADGSFRAALSGSPFIGVGARREAECIQETCTVAVLGMSDAPGQEASVWDVLGVLERPLEWAEPTADYTAPDLSVSELRLDYASNEGSLRVRGTGFTPGSEVALVQCPRSEDGGVAAGDCLYDFGTVVVADESGEIDAPLTVYPRFQRSDDSLVECDGGADTECYVGAPWPRPGDSNRYVMVPMVDDE